jgi:LCP family protein required for cell wall assembly
MAQETPVPIAEPMPIVDEGGYDIINVLLLGMATHNEGSNGLTDSMLVVSFNRDTGHTAIVSLPRDLYVYLPNRGEMSKLNQAYYYGEKYDDGYTGLDELKATILYNLGLQIDYTARLNFNGFIRLIDRLGGVEMSVDCGIQDWRLKSPELDRTVAENYEKFTLEPGVYTLDGDTALWYVRSRKTSTDLDRGRRQQDILRAIWRTIRAQGVIGNLPVLWESWGDIITTDIPFDVALSYLPDIVDLNTSDISYFTFRIKKEVNNGYTPDAEQRYILVPDRDAIAALMQQVVMPTTGNQVTAIRPTIAIVNATGDSYFDYLAQIAADRLELDGFRTTIVEEATSSRNFNHIIDYTGETKGSKLETLMRVLSTTIEGVEVTPQSERTFDYKVYIGYNYQFYACTRPIIPPAPEATPTPNG